MGLRHYTCIGNHKPSILYSIQGAPQGTTSGPILFNVSDDVVPDYVVCKFNSSSCHTAITTFADDKIPLITGSTGDDDRVAHLVQEMKMLYHAKNLVFNDQKTYEILVNFSKHVPAPIDHIEWVTSVKIINITFDERLTFCEHVEKICRKASSNVSLLRKIKQMGYNSDEMDMLHKSLVLSALTYGCAVLGGCGSTILDRIDAIQRKSSTYGSFEFIHPIKKKIINSKMQRKTSSGSTTKQRTHPKSLDT